jgi:hypothetical protein
VERERLNEVFQVARHELMWAVKERAKIGNGSSQLTRFDEVIRVARQHTQQAGAKYYGHIVSHGCVSHTEVAGLLKDQLDQARDGYLAASARFDSVFKSGAELPHPDGTLNIQQVGRTARNALDRYMSALRRFSDFVASGTLPDEFLPPEE